MLRYRWRVDWVGVPVPPIFTSHSFFFAATRLNSQVFVGLDVESRLVVLAEKRIVSIVSSLAPGVNQTV
jgi:hypothetical protein